MGAAAQSRAVVMAGCASVTRLASFVDCDKTQGSVRGTDRSSQSGARRLRLSDFPISCAMRTAAV